MTEDERNKGAQFRAALETTVAYHLEIIAIEWRQWNQNGYPLRDSIRRARAVLAELEAAHGGDGVPR